MKDVLWGSRWHASHPLLLFRKRCTQGPGGARTPKTESADGTQGPAFGHLCNPPPCTQLPPRAPAPAESHLPSTRGPDADHEGTLMAQQCRGHIRNLGTRQALRGCPANTMSASCEHLRAGTAEHTPRSRQEGQQGMPGDARLLMGTESWNRPALGLGARVVCLMPSTEG